MFSLFILALSLIHTHAPAHAHIHTRTHTKHTKRFCPPLTVDIDPHRSEEDN